ncbi:hypothetical protein Tco_1392934 [Tanacetum coccineum]
MEPLMITKRVSTSLVKASLRTTTKEERRTGTATEKVAKAFEQTPRMVGNRRSCDMSKYCHFHKDHGHETNQCWELRHQIEEAVKSGQLAHLVKGIKSHRVDSKISLVGFSGEHSWPLGKVPLEVSVGESPYTRTKTLNFVIVRSNSPYNILLGRTTMQKMGIVVSTIHAEVKFHTPCGIGTMFSTYETQHVGKRLTKKIKEWFQGDKGRS